MSGQSIRVRALEFIGPDGMYMTPAQLPPRGLKRWLPHHKALIVAAMRHGLRTERIDRAMRKLMGSCRFNLDPTCSDSEVWLQDDQKSGERCGFALTRLFAATPTVPEFVESASFSASTAPLGGVKPVSSVSIDTGSVKLFELLYIHKVCPSGTTIVRNG